MAFGKNKLTKFNVEATYHTVIKVNIDLTQVPTPILDENGLPTGEYVPNTGSRSSVTVASYVSKESYLKRCAPLETKDYLFDFLTTTAVVNSTDKSCKEAVYFLLKSVDEFWTDAETV